MDKLKKHIVLIESVRKLKTCAFNETPPYFLTDVCWVHETAMNFDLK